MNIIIAGAGRMGRCVGWALNKLGHSIRFLDSSQESLDLAQKIVPEAKVEKFVLNIGLDSITEPTISCLPYLENYNIAHYCINHNISYFDLGGSVEVSQRINEYASKDKFRERNSVVLTDLGLAPGAINIYTEALIKNKTPISIGMYVGGLPQRAIYGDEDYALTWSSEGLVNQYTSPCEVLIGGKIETVPALSWKEDILNLEAFTTSGGLSHIKDLQERGVYNCSYKTLRYKGHLDKLKVLSKALSKQEFQKALEKLYPPTQNDFVILHVKAEIQENYGPVNLEFTKRIYADNDWTAMQKSTGFFCASAVDAALENQGKITYKDLNLTRFFHNLETLGL